jgi:hypothetical protein
MPDGADWLACSVTFIAIRSKRAAAPCALAIHPGFARHNLPE